LRSAKVRIEVLPPEPVIEVADLEVHFPVRQGLFNRQVGLVKAVDGVSFTVSPGETLGLVGESGSGKTTIGRSVLRAIEPTAGRISFTHEGTTVDLTSLSHRELRPMRRHLQMIFQDPYSSLNARMPIRDIIAEPLVAQRLASGSELDDRIRDIALRCKLNLDHLGRYPHAFSGGQRQRIGIARALVSRPAFVVADEAVSALDVSIQAEILNLLADLQEDLGLSMLFIAHDLAVVAHLAHRVAVLHLGQIVELASTSELFGNPRHPYTEALLSAIPSVDPDRRLAPVSLGAEVPSAGNPPQGCRFHTRCAYVADRCRTDEPAWETAPSGRGVRCHFADELDLAGTDAIAAPG
jgi:peptide/nickel transport system ATP-binding protein